MNWLQWGRATESAETDIGETRIFATMLLHWGRATEESTETGNAGVAEVQGGQDSMEPRSGERENCEVERIARAVIDASMEPRYEERGNSISPAVMAATSVALQWGRAPKSAEIA